MYQSFIETLYQKINPLGRKGIAAPEQGGTPNAAEHFAYSFTLGALIMLEALSHEPRHEPNDEEHF